MSSAQWLVFRDIWLPRPNSKYHWWWSLAPRLVTFKLISLLVFLSSSRDSSQTLPRGILMGMGWILLAKRINCSMIILQYITTWLFLYFAFVEHAIEQTLVPSWRTAKCQRRLSCSNKLTIWSRISYLWGAQRVSRSGVPDSAPAQALRKGTCEAFPVTSARRHKYEVHHSWLSFDNTKLSLPITPFLNEVYVSPKWEIMAARSLMLFEIWWWRSQLKPFMHLKWSLSFVPHRYISRLPDSIPRAASKDQKQLSKSQPFLSVYFSHRHFFPLPKVKMVALKFLHTAVLFALYTTTTAVSAITYRPSRGLKLWY